MPNAKFLDSFFILIPKFMHAIGIKHDFIYRIELIFQIVLKEGLKLLNVPCDWAVSVCCVWSQYKQSRCHVCHVAHHNVCKGGHNTALSLVTIGHVTWIQSCDWLQSGQLCGQPSVVNLSVLMDVIIPRCNSITWWTLIHHSWLKGSKNRLIRKYQRPSPINGLD